MNKYLYPKIPRKYKCPFAKRQHAGFKWRKSRFHIRLERGIFLRFINVQRFFLCDFPSLILPDFSCINLIRAQHLIKRLRKTLKKWFFKHFLTFQMFQNFGIEMFQKYWRNENKTCKFKLKFEELILPSMENKGHASCIYICCKNVINEYKTM